MPYMRVIKTECCKKSGLLIASPISMSSSCENFLLRASSVFASSVKTFNNCSVEVVLSTDWVISNSVIVVILVEQLVTLTDYTNIQQLIYISKCFVINLLIGLAYALLKELFHLQRFCLLSIWSSVDSWNSSLNRTSLQEVSAVKYSVSDL